MSGRVWLVGAGPGAPDLLTLRGQACLAQADVVVHDRLIQPAILELAPAAAHRIDVGKQPHGTSWRQQDINAVLIEHAQRGARVVRLKGGDPFVFGRGSEEVQALAAAGVRVEVVPGVSSVLAAPAAAGIPLTHRGLARSFTVATGTAIDGTELSPAEMDRLAACNGTLVILMAMHRLDELVDRLLAHGRTPDEPCAVVMHATWPTERTVRAPLGQIAAHAVLQDLQPPALLVIGPTVGLGGEGQ